MIEGISTLPSSAWRTEEGTPRAYRLGKRHGELVLQGAYFWTQGFEGGHEWRDIPIVDLDPADKPQKPADQCLESSSAPCRFKNSGLCVHCAPSAAPLVVTDETEWPKQGDLVRYADGVTALALHGEPHASGWHGTQCMGGFTFYTKTYRPTEADRWQWVESATRYRGRTLEEARKEAGIKATDEGPRS